MSTREEIMDTLGTAGRRAFGWLQETFPKFGDSLAGSVADMERQSGNMSPAEIKRRYEKRAGNMRIVPVSPLGDEPLARQHLFHYPKSGNFNDYVIDPHSPLHDWKPERIQMENGTEEWFFPFERVRVNPSMTACAGGGPCAPRAMYALLRGRKSFESVVKDLQIANYLSWGGPSQVINPIEGTPWRASFDYLDNLNVDRVNHHTGPVHANTRHKDVRDIINKPGDTLVSIVKESNGGFHDGSFSHAMTFRNGIPVGAARNDVYLPHDYDYISAYSSPREGGMYIPRQVYPPHKFVGGEIEDTMMSKLAEQGKYIGDESLPEYPDLDAGEGFTESSFLRNYRLDGSLGPPYMQLDRYYKAQNQSR